MLFLATGVTTSAMGTLMAAAEAVPDTGDPMVALGALGTAILTDGSYVAAGLLFSFTLLGILLAHELGHYLTCRYYGIDATLPYFIPAPPPVLIGTFGAFIRIKSPFPSRRALFDVGVAGPIAGFVFALPAAVIGLLYATPAPVSSPEGVIVFQDPLLFILVQKVAGLPAVLNWNPIYFAAWAGMLATGLNLLPVGQLDGGHATFALLGDRGHRGLSLLFFGFMILLATVSMARYGSPAYFLFVALLSLLVFRSHPPTLHDEAEIGLGRCLVAVLTAAIFILSFIPFPVVME
jgi:membrane-associated protease RseP (regulator of RpoE activity)